MTRQLSHAPSRMRKKSMASDTSTPHVPKISGGDAEKSSADHGGPDHRGSSAEGMTKPSTATLGAGEADDDGEAEAVEAEVAAAEGSDDAHAKTTRCEDGRHAGRACGFLWTGEATPFWREERGRARENAGRFIVENVGLRTSAVDV